MEGFERQNQVVFGGPASSYVAAGSSVSFIAGRVADPGAICLNLGANNSTGTSYTQNFPTGLSGFAVGFAHKGSASQSFGLTGATFARFRETAILHVQLRRNTTTGQMEVLGAAGTVLATSVEQIAINVWNYFEVEIVIHDTTGSIKVWMNTQLIINLTNVDTKNGGTGVVNNFQLIGDATISTSTQIDDVYCVDLTGSAPFNARLGDIVINRLDLTAQGALNAWVGSDGNSVDNWALIDEAVATMTDYIGTATAGARDLSVLQDMPASSASALAVEVSAFMLKSDAGAPASQAQALLRSAAGAVAAQDLGSSANLTTTAAWFRENFRLTDPDGNPWTVARVNALQAGVGLT